MSRIIRKPIQGWIGPDISALEVFGADGSGVTRDYAHIVSSLEIWEIDKKYENELKKKFPNAKIKITDSFKEVCETSEKFNFIVVDNGISTYGSYCEHFELFPSIFRIMEDSAILTVNIIPSVSKKMRKKWPYVFNKLHLEKRMSFYNSDHPENLTASQMIQTYEQLCKQNGFRIVHHFVMKRRFFLHFLVMHIQRISRKQILFARA